MKSRYDFMTESNTLDDLIGDVYPDPLSLNYLNISISPERYPYTAELNNKTINKIWKICNSVYGRAELDDIVLTLNGVEHKNFLEVGDKLLFPSEKDIDLSFEK